MAFFDPQKTREQYLERLLARYGTVTLPIDSARLAIPLQTVFQPMVLRRDPLAPQEGLSMMESEVVKARDGAEALTKSEARRMVVLGGPGMGKTTALKALLYTAITTAQIDPSAPLPLFISLPDLMRAKLSFEEYIQHVVTELDIDQRFASILMVAVNNGNAFLCLDSLDEVLPALRPEVIAFLNEEALRCQGTWIIGSRFTEYKGGQFAHSQFAEWELQTLGEQQRLTLARQLLPAIYNALYRDVVQSLKPALPLAEAFIEELQLSTQNTTWGENPLLLSLAAVLYVQTGRLPDSRAVLYAQVMETMFTMRLHDARQRAELRHLLADLALEFYQTRGRNFNIKDALEFLPSLLSGQNTPSSLSATLALLLDSGVLEPVAYQVYGFKHQMFQEYLAAVALARRCMDETLRQSAWNLLWRKRRLSRWNEILRLFVGILVQEHGIEGLLIAREWLSALAMEQSTAEGDPGNLCLILAMKSLGEFGERVSEPDVAGLAQYIVEIWEKTLAELSRQGGWRYTQPLREQAHVLCAFNLQIVAPIILRLQQLDPQIQNFCSLPAASGLIDTSFPMNILWHLFQERPIGFYACHTARVLQTPAVIERLVAILKDAEHWSVEDRTEVVMLLGKMGENIPVSLLIEIWQDSTLDDNLRTSAAEALSEAEVPVPVDVFIAMLNDRHFFIRGVAIKALNKLGGQTYIGLFLSALQDSDDYVRVVAFTCLRELGVALPMEVLQTLFYDVRVDIEQEAWKRLHAMGELVPIELWLDALQHEYPSVRKCALLSIEHYRDRIPVEPILAMLAVGKKDAYSRIDVRTSCIEALGLLGDRVPLEPLLELLQHSDKNLRSSALFVLNQRHVVLSADILLPMLHDSATGDAAVQAIVAMGADAPISSLLEIARSYSSNSHFAIKALRLLYLHVPSEPVLELLQDEEIRDSSWGTYWELIQLLQLQGMEISLELLLPVLKRPPFEEVDIIPILASFCRAGAQAPIESLLRLIYEETRTSRTLFTSPKWIQQLFYVLHEWVSPDHLINALGNTPTDQWLAVSLLGRVHDDECIQLITDVAQDPTRDRTTRSEAMVVLSDLGVNLPLEYLLDATRWCIYEGMGGYLVDTVKRLGKQTPIEQLLPLLGEDHNRLQPGVVEALAGIAEYIPLETMLPLLEGKDEVIRHAAIRILGAMKERAPLDVFEALLDNHEQTLETRCAVLRALGEIGTSRAVDLLLKALEDNEEEIKRSALWALKDDEMETRRGGLRAFKEQGKKIPLEPLLKLLNDPETSVIQNSIAVLGELGSLGVAIPIEPLVSLLSHEDEYVAGDAAEALCKLGERAPIDTLLDTMYHATNHEVSGAIFYALSFLEAHAPLEAMLAALLDNEKLAKGWRIDFALQRLARSVPEQMLERLHDDPRPSIRRVVLEAIQTTKGCEWLPLVLATLHDADQYVAHDQNRYNAGSSYGTVRSAVIQAFGALNACAPIEPLLQLLYTNKKELSYDDERLVVLEALRQFGSRVPLSVLWPLLGSDHTEICRLVFQHIQEAYPTALKELAPILKEIVRGEPVQDPFAARMHYRIAEIVALMGRATPAVLAMVINLLDHPFWEVRVRAAKTLGTLRRNIPDSAIRRLLELRKDPESPDVRVTADQALAEILSLEQGMEEE